MKEYTEFYAGSLSKVKEADREKFLKEANEKREKKELDKLHISIVPTLVTKELLKLLKQYNVMTVELEVKIANSFILKKYRANFEMEDIKKASKLIKRSRLKLGYQVMIGFPDSTKIDEQESAKFLIKFRPSLVRIYPVCVIEGTEVEEAYKNGEYEPLTLAQAIERCKEQIYMFNKKKIKAITVGIIDENNIDKEEKQVIAGPTHKNFAQLVEDSIWYDSIVGKIKKYNSKVKQVKVEVNPSNVDNVIGYENENINRFKEFYSVEMQVLPNENIKPGRSQMKILTVYED